MTTAPPSVEAVEIPLRVAVAVEIPLGAVERPLHATFFSPYYHVEATYSVEAYTCLGLLAGAATSTADAEGNTGTHAHASMTAMFLNFTLSWFLVVLLILLTTSPAKSLLQTICQFFKSITR